MGFRGYLLQNEDYTHTIDTRVMTAMVDVVGGINKGLCCHVIGEDVVVVKGVNIPIPKINIASISDNSTLPIFGMVIEDGADQEIVKVVNNGLITGVVDTSLWTAGDTLYLMENGTISNTPSTGIEGIIQIGTVAKVGVTDGAIQLGMQHFTATAELDGVLRQTIVNTSGGASSASTYTVKNDLGYYASFGINSSGLIGFPPNNSFVFNNGYGEHVQVIDGDKDFVWLADPTDSHNLSVVEAMRLTPSGFLNLKGGAVAVNAFLDEDGFDSDSNEALATQQSIKAYVDNEILKISMIREQSVQEYDGINKNSTKIQYTVPVNKVLYINQWHVAIVEGDKETFEISADGVGKAGVSGGQAKDGSESVLYDPRNPLGPFAEGVEITVEMVEGQGNKNWGAGFTGYLEDV